jgi:hypothetical protein
MRPGDRPLDGRASNALHNDRALPPGNKLPEPSARRPPSRLGLCAGFAHRLSMRASGAGAVTQTAAGTLTRALLARIVCGASRLFSILTLFGRGLDVCSAGAAHTAPRA